MSCPVFDVFLESGKEGWVLVWESVFVFSFHSARKENGEWVVTINTFYLDQNLTVNTMLHLDRNENLKSQQGSLLFHSWSKLIT